jgi:hypothetical protein
MPHPVGFIGTPKFARLLHVVAMFGPSVLADLLWPVLTPARSHAASLRRALHVIHASAAVFSLARAATAGKPHAWFVSGSARPGRSSLACRLPPHGQVCPGKNANCRCASAAFTVGSVPVGFAVMCQLRLAALGVVCGFCPSPRTSCTPASSRQGLAEPALAFGSWLSLLTMSPSRYSHRGLPPQKFAPMLGAHPSLWAPVRTC